MEQEDDQKIAGFQAGDREAVKMIFERYKIPVLKFCMRLLGNRADAEETAGDVFLTLLSTSYHPHPEAKFSTWLYTIARNKCVSQLRKRKGILPLWFLSEDGTTEEPWDIPDPQDLSCEEFDKKERAEQVRKAIAKLPFEQKRSACAQTIRRFQLS